MSFWQMWLNSISSAQSFRPASRLRNVRQAQTSTDEPDSTGGDLRRYVPPLVTAFAEPLPWFRGCTAPQQVTRFTGKLANTADAIRPRKRLLRVAIG